MIENSDGSFSFFFNPANQPQYLGPDTILINDNDPDLDDFSITRVGSELPDTNGDFAGVTGSDFGEIFMLNDGTFEFRISADEYQDPDLFQTGEFVDPLSTFFEYEITDDSPDMAMDTAFIEIIVAQEVELD